MEKEYQHLMQEPLKKARAIKKADIVIGIPFYNESETIGDVFKTAREGLETFYPEKKGVIICVGAQVGGKALDVINNISSKEISYNIEIISFLLKGKISGRGWAIRAIMEISNLLQADLAVFSADLTSFKEEGRIKGLSHEWVRLLLEPVKKDGFDFVFSRYNRHYFDSGITRLFVIPLISAIYGKRIAEPISGEFGISHRALFRYLQDPEVWLSETGYYGIDSFLATSAIINNFRMCEVNLGIKPHQASSGKIKLIFRGIAKGIFERILEDSDFWREKSGVLSYVDSYGFKKEDAPPSIDLSYKELVNEYRMGVNRFVYLYGDILPANICNDLLQLADCPREEFELSGRLWAKIVYQFLLSFSFGKELKREDIINGLLPIFLGRLGSFVRVLKQLQRKLEITAHNHSTPIIFNEAERLFSNEIELFLLEREDFIRDWNKKEKPLKPYLSKIGSWEFIPHVPLIVPQEIATKTGNLVRAQDIYKSLLDRYRTEFQQFISQRLRLKKDISSLTILKTVKDFMSNTERGFDKFLFPGNLYTVEGTEKVVSSIFRYFPPKKGFSLKEEVAYRMIRKNPPSNLITRLGFFDLPQLLRDYTPCDVLALASWSEEREYIEGIWDELRKTAIPSDFESSYIVPIVVSYSSFPALAEMKDQSALNRLTGRIVISNLPKAKGGEFPKIRYFTTIAKNIIEAERFGKIWEEFSKESDFGNRVINSLQGHWGRTPLSAHNIFENGNQRALVQRMIHMAERIKNEASEAGDIEKINLASRIEDLSSVYHLALTLPDNTFIPLSAWTWASYSFKGGREFPTPFSLHVERNWTSADFLLEYSKACGLADKPAVERKIIELMGEGRESEDLAHHLLGLEKEAERVLSDKLPILKEIPAGSLTRLTKGPIIEPIQDHWWESKFVFNCASVRIRDKIFILYRAVGHEPNVSYIGLAMSKDGVTIDERLDHPIFSPEEDYEGANFRDPASTKGCEDPRAALIGDRLYMLYTANSGSVSQIAMASIGIDDFISYNWNAWVRHGPTFPNFPNKDAILFSEKFSGKFVVFHRIYPDIWLSYLDNLDPPWPSQGQKIIITPRAGMVWDGVYIGAGAQPIKTSWGWLIIYHGVDYLRIYRLGLILVDLNDPGEVLYRSPNAILEPERDYEIGKGKGIYWVPQVVFTCGAVAASNKYTLDADDSILVYYGAADTVIGVAGARIGDLIPHEVRERIEASM
ncbi:MAG: glycosidase [Deltaproteobacteria bacterium]|nr:glycosidase [Deltaproteobacteria bacterium]